MRNYIFLVFLYLFSGLPKTGYADVPEINTELSCEVTFVNYVDTESYSPQVFDGYSDGYRVGDFLNLSISLSYEMVENYGLGFHVTLSDKERDAVVFFAGTSARRSMQDYPEIDRWGDEFGIGSEGYIFGDINYNASHIYAEGVSWGFMSLDSREARINIQRVRQGLYRGTLTVLPQRDHESYIFEFSQLECRMVKDSLAEFLEYYSQ